MKNLLTLTFMSFIAIIMTSCATKPKDFKPELKSSLYTMDAVDKLLTVEEYVKGFNTSTCIALKMQDGIPIQVSLLYCACAEEVKAEILKSEYPKYSAEFESESVIQLCQDYTKTYMQGPELIEKLKEENFPKRSPHQFDHYGDRGDMHERGDKR